MLILKKKTFSQYRYSYVFTLQMRCGQPGVDPSAKVSIRCWCRRRSEGWPVSQVWSGTCTLRTASGWYRCPILKYTSTPHSGSRLRVCASEIKKMKNTLQQRLCSSYLRAAASIHIASPQYHHIYSPWRLIWRILGVFWKKKNNLIENRQYSQILQESITQWYRFFVSWRLVVRIAL